MHAAHFHAQSSELVVVWLCSRCAAINTRNYMHFTVAILFRVCVREVLVLELRIILTHKTHTETDAALGCIRLRSCVSPFINANYGE